MVVIFSGGGTGGHLYPALAIAEALSGVRPDVEPFFVGAQRGIEARILPQRELPHLLVPVEGLRRGVVLGNLGVLARMTSGVWRVLGKMRELRPGAVVVTGGFASAPAGFAALALRIPLVLQEQNETPGITTRLLARWADQIHIAYPEARNRLPHRVQPRVMESGNPIKPPADIARSVAREGFGLSGDGPVLLVVGGSQGSAALNSLMVDAFRCASLDRWQILWATGPRHFDAVSEALGTLPANLRLVAYIDDMPPALACADLAVSRAGAMTTSEFLAWGLPSVLVPLPSAAADHQRRNAQALEAAGVSVVLKEGTTTGEQLGDVVSALGMDRSRLTQMAKKALNRARPHAGRDIAISVASLLPPVNSGAA